jgi:hypothetical protein
MRCPPSAPRMPIRAPAIAATDHARRVPERLAGIGRREARYATKPGTWALSPGATPPRACRLRVASRRGGLPPPFPVSWHTRKLRCPPGRAHPHPHAGGRGDGRRAAERRPASGCGSALWRHSLADFGHRKAIARRNRATGGQAHDGASARRRKCARVSRRTDLRTRAEGDGGAQCRPAKTNCERATLKPRLQCTPLPPE